MANVHVWYRCLASSNQEDLLDVGQNSMSNRSSTSQLQVDKWWVWMVYFTGHTCIVLKKMSITGQDSFSPALTALSSRQLSVLYPVLGSNLSQWCWVDIVIVLLLRPPLILLASPEHISLISHLFYIFIWTIFWDKLTTQIYMLNIGYCQLSGICHMHGATGVLLSDPSSLEPRQLGRHDHEHFHQLLVSYCHGKQWSQIHMCVQWMLYWRFNWQITIGVLTVNRHF